MSQSEICRDNSSQDGVMMGVGYYELLSPTSNNMRMFSGIF